MFRTHVLKVLVVLALPAIAHAQNRIVVDSPFHTHPNDGGTYGTPGSYQETRELDNAVRREVLKELQHNREQREYDESPVGQFFGKSDTHHSSDDAVSDAIGRAIFDSLNRR